MARRPTPFDEHAARVAEVGYHAHRGSTHSNIISEGIVHDLRAACGSLEADLASGKVGCWLNIRIPFHEESWDADLVVAEPDDDSVANAHRPASWPPSGAAALAGSRPDGRKLRLVMEHKSVVTAHRNRKNRFKELATDVKYSNDAGANVIVGATILVGTAPRVLNVVDGIRSKLYVIRGKSHVYDEERFEREVGRRLRAKDPTVWDEYPGFVSANKPTDAEKTASYFRLNLIERSPDRWNQPGLDALLIIPVYYDNVGTARVDREHALGKTFDADYRAFLEKLCSAYTRRWKGPARR